MYGCYQFEATVICVVPEWITKKARLEKEKQLNRKRKTLLINYSSEAKTRLEATRKLKSLKHKDWNYQSLEKYIDKTEHRSGQSGQRVEENELRLAIDRESFEDDLTTIP